MKNFRKISTWILATVLTGFFLLSCNKDEPYTIDCSDGVFIVNEGAFGSSNGSVSFYSNTNDIVTNDVFAKVNGYQLGDVVQSLTVAGDSVFIVVNNSNKIVAAHIKTMISTKNTITGVAQPRYMVAKNKTAFVSCWGDNSVKVIDLNTFSVTGSINTDGYGPDKMLLKNNKLYVLNSNDSTVAVINTADNSVLSHIVVPYNPKDIVEDKNGSIWVLSYGNELYNSDWTEIIGHTPSYLYKIDPLSDVVIATLELFADKHPMHLEIDKDGSTMFIGGGYTFGGIYKVSVSGLNLDIQEMSGDFAYGLHADPVSGVLFVSLSGDYKSGGTLKRYQNDGTLLGTYTCGIGTSGAAFKNTGK
ncbi:MAG: hypothetical protein JXB34_11075 [Bacteroidales bacterium]|nr:hypothetical protein [Bacteroidales bacterium]